MARLSFRCADDMVALVDAVRGQVPRERWLRGAVWQALAADRPAVMGMPVHVDERVERDHVVVVPPGPDVENIRSSGQAKRDVRPVPKGKP